MIDIFEESEFDGREIKGSFLEDEIRNKIIVGMLNSEVFSYIISYI